MSPECRTHVRERIVPAILDPIVGILLDTLRDKLSRREVARATGDQCLCLRGPRMVHVDHDIRADRATHENGLLTGGGVIDRLPARLGNVV